MDAGGTNYGKVPGESERRFVQLGPDSVTASAESIGLSGLSPGVARALAEDASYRVREVASLCALLLKHGKRRKLTVEDMNRALTWSNVEPVLGEGGGAEVATSQLYQYLPEAEVFVARDSEIDLVEASQNSLPSGDLNLNISASWLAVEGSGGQPGTESGTLTPALYQYYSAVVNHVLGDSESLCTTILRDIRTNTKLAPLLPYLVTFLRQGLKKYPDKPHLSIRLLRLMSSIFYNPYLNLSPKPYLSHLVTALLTTILGSDSSRSISLVPLAASILSLALARWATPVNQLQSQTLRHLREFVNLERGSEGGGGYQVTPQTQYGALTTLTLLGPRVLCDSLTPWPSHLTDHLTNDPSSGVFTRGVILRSGAALINHWLADPDHCTPMWDLYGQLYQVFGDSVVQEVRLMNVGSDSGKDRPPDPPGKLRLFKLRMLGRFRRDSKPRVAEASQPGLLTASQNFDFLADMGVPSDIFEPVTERDSMMDVGLEPHYKHHQQPGGGSLSNRILEVFPSSPGICLRSKRGTLCMKLPFRQWGPDRLRQHGALSSARAKPNPVPWRQVVSGGRVGTAARRREAGRVSKMPNYINFFI